MEYNLTKEQAMRAMGAGKKVAHRSFLPDEWMTIKNGMVLLEDGVSCHIHLFWMWRTDASWKDGYAIID